MIGSVLIANRGEIACRIIRTARRMGIRTFAVYSEADRDALHVRMADEARLIGPAEARRSYLNSEVIISVAKEVEAGAIHPGYGFLAENADFAQACVDSGIVFMGPTPDAIRAMGDKAAAKALMEKAGVPVVPGYHGKDQKAARLLDEAETIGWPVLLKASAGGGGKGMRIVAGRGEFDDALDSARREAQAAFGNDRMLVEKYIQRPRHIEVQIFGDSHGNVVHLFERDCSVQRRHQKVIEEAPGPGVSAEWRERICRAAVDAARAVDYRGAGTVEFIVESGDGGAPGDFWFMEMNTRLQVEHPVTEMITGVDLVEWQFRVASGGALPAAQADITMGGHAVEVRLYAEDPDAGFLPSPGTLHFIALPRTDGNVRVDTGVAGKGSKIPPEYDPMIAKIIACGNTRGEAVAKLKAAVDEIRVAGVASNAPFLGRALAHAEFVAGGADTGFLDRAAADLLPPQQAAPPRILALACLGILRRQKADAAEAARRSADPWSPWARADGWRLNDVGHTVVRLVNQGEIVDIPCRFDGDAYILEPGGEALRASLEMADNPYPVDSDILIGGDMGVYLDGLRTSATVVRDGDQLHVFHAGDRWRLGIHDPLTAAESQEGAAGVLASPMPGRIAAVHVMPGDEVRAGQQLVVVEAMKMEHGIRAASDGRVAEVRFKAGDQVAEGEILVVVEEPAG